MDHYLTEQDYANMAELERSMRRDVQQQQADGEVDFDDDDDDDNDVAAFFDNQRDYCGCCFGGRCAEPGCATMIHKAEYEKEQAAAASAPATAETTAQDHRAGTSSSLSTTTGNGQQQQQRPPSQHQHQHQHQHQTQSHNAVDAPPRAASQGTRPTTEHTHANKNTSAHPKSYGFEDQNDHADAYMCPDGTFCQSMNGVCPYNHPNVRECRHAGFCQRAGCKFNHPPSWVQAAQCWCKYDLLGGCNMRTNGCPFNHFNAIDCYAGMGCGTFGCPHNHPPEWVSWVVFNSNQ